MAHQIVIVTNSFTYWSTVSQKNEYSVTEANNINLCAIHGKKYNFVSFVCV